MNILFLTLVKIQSLDERGIYSDLLRKFRNEGHKVFVISPVERRDKRKTFLKKEHGANLLNVWTFNLQKTNVLEKGVATLAIEYQYLNALKKYFGNVKFDLVLYSTPPITFSKIISFVKRRDNAYAYLLLKDIFPQNAVDMKMLQQNGLLHNFFLKKERKLYNISDAIGCMSEKNKSYLLEHNDYLNSFKVEVNPNSIEPVYVSDLTSAQRVEIRQKYGLPADKKIFVYGGNLGKPQGIDFLLDTISNTTFPEVFFLVIGSGTEYERIKKWFDLTNPANAKLLNGLPKTEYDKLLNACNVGMIFLHKDFTIPNFPSRLLSYLEMRMPVLAATDPNTDVGYTIEAANCGYGVISDDAAAMQEAIKKLISSPAEFERMSENAWNLLQEQYTVTHSYDLILNRINNVSFNN